MTEPPIEVLTNKLGVSGHGLVILASKRARQINAYYNQLGEGLGRYVPPQVIVQGKPLSIALEEIAQDKLVAQRPEDPKAELPVEGA